MSNVNGETQRTFRKTRFLALTSFSKSVATGQNPDVLT